MDPKLFSTVFISIFLAEMADKTQLATLVYAADAKNSKWVIFVAATLALAATSAIAVFAGGMLAQWVDEKLMARLAGIAFMVIGVWIFFRG